MFGLQMLVPRPTVFLRHSRMTITRSMNTSFRTLAPNIRFILMLAACMPSTAMAEGVGPMFIVEIFLAIYVYPPLTLLCVWIAMYLKSKPTYPWAFANLGMAVLLILSLPLGLNVYFIVGCFFVLSCSAPALFIVQLITLGRRFRSRNKKGC